MISEKKVFEALAQVIDPELGKDLVSLNRVQNIRIEGKRIFFTLVLTTAHHDIKGQLNQSCERILHELVDKEAEIHITFDTRPQSALLDANPLPNVKHIIGVFSGKGGVGKSTVAAHLALSLAQKSPNNKVGLMDADIFGPSVPIMFGVQGIRPEVQRVDGKNRITPIQKYGVSLMSIGLLIDTQQAVIWRGPMASKALRQFITDVYWNDLDYLVVDMPPGTSDIHLTLLQTIQLSGAVIVSTPQKVAIADAEKAIMMFKQTETNVPILGIIENMAYFTPSELPQNKYYIFGKGGAQQLAQTHQLPFLGALPLIQSICEGCDKGMPEIMDVHTHTASFFHQIADKIVCSLS